MCPTGVFSGMVEAVAARYNATSGILRDTKRSACHTLRRRAYGVVLAVCDVGHGGRMLSRLWIRCGVLGALGVLANGCSDYEINSKDEPVAGTTASVAPAISVSPLLVDFGVRTDTDLVSQLVTIENIGDADLRVGAVRLEGASVFSVTQPETDTLVPGAALTVVVSFAPPADTSEHTARLDIASNDPWQPTSSVDIRGAVAFEIVDSGDPGPDESAECGCPEGFSVADDESHCFRETETPAVASGAVVDVCPITPYVTYGKFGARYPGGAAVRDTYWGQDDGISNGRLNAVGVWGCASSGSGLAGSAPVGSWIGFSVCVDVVADGDYLVGLGGDNRVRFAVDGAQVMEQTDDDTRNFNYWWMHAVPLAAGTHILDIEGYNAGSLAAFGAEIAGPFPSGSLTDDAAMQAADYAGSIVWSTADAIGNAFPIGDSVSWECPDGAVLRGCEAPVCVAREEVPCETAPVD